MPETTEKDLLEQAFEKMYQAFGILKNKAVVQDRHTSIVKTKLEEAMMWLNKNRASKEYFEKKLETHVEG